MGYVWKAINIVINSLEIEDSKKQWPNHHHDEKGEGLEIGPKRFSTQLTKRDLTSHSDRAEKMMCSVEGGACGLDGQ